MVSRKPITASTTSGPAASRRALFPDEEHAYHPSRRAQFAKLSKNALPPPPSPTRNQHATYAPRQLPPTQHTGKQFAPPKKSSNHIASSTPSSTKSHKRHQQRIANPCDADLWGFPVYFSPANEVKTQWELAAQSQGCSELSASLLNTNDAAAAVKASEDLERRSRQDYSQYLYFAAKYGPLDTLLYCCTPLPGHVYALLVEQSARKLQLWSRDRVKALRNHWVARLSRELSAQSLALGSQLVAQSFEHQQRAGAFLRRLRWHVAAKALRNWFEYTQKQLEVKWRFNFCAGEDLRARFRRWKSHVDAVKAFKKQLKTVAKRKRMAGVFAQWQQWQTQQEQATQLLMKRWMKTQRDCLATWCARVKASKQSNHAAIVIQRHWRGFHQRTTYQRTRQAQTLLARVGRGWLARKRVRDLQAAMAVGQTLLQLTRRIAWRDRCDTLQSIRDSIMLREIEREAYENEFVSAAEAQAAAFLRDELDKVVRNEMHQRLQDAIKRLSESGDMAMMETARSNREKLIQLATDKVAEEEQSEARRQARVGFRSLEPGNSPRTDCLVCYAASTIVCKDIEVISIAQRGSSHKCAQFVLGQEQLPTESVRRSIEELRDQEEAHERALLLQDLPVPVLWRELQLA